MAEFRELEEETQDVESRNPQQKKFIADQRPRKAPGQLKSSARTSISSSCNRGGRIKQRAEVQGRRRSLEHFISREVICGVYQLAQAKSFFATVALRKKWRGVKLTIQFRSANQVYNKQREGREGTLI
ncbi:predicted protein [Uncinocarpus reesii 1704]|uniref:Uncharacterized protein n=1 Tax=Uncinocarpus reesii (strain UAMH 1704) TaxID=336963 RepID=C4JG70_UNCRE|nr:uncharacterized protein UREG_02468 [Uncinocarpus reesii 1704]EEP77619.1 predicted protein [Uncinocarpus reesii 1704]